MKRLIYVFAQTPLVFTEICAHISELFCLFSILTGINYIRLKGIVLTHNNYLKDVFINTDILTETIKLKKGEQKWQKFIMKRMLKEIY
jgi:hypothetical protein